MSRIGKAPILLPDKVEVSINGQEVSVKGPLGSLTRTFRPEVKITLSDKQLLVTRVNETREARSLHGLSRTLLNNMVVGVSQGFTKNLEIIGVGYRAQMQGKVLTLQLGYSHPVTLEPPAGVEIVVEANTKLAVKGIDKQAVGDIASHIRGFRPPEPYKGKGIRYLGERVRRKVGKAGKK
jgi:large subunit ribosomal protein L6